MAMGATNASTRRFQNTLGSSLKFWQVTRDGNRLYFQWGRIGTDGQPLMKAYSTEWRAEHEMNLLVSQKLAKGYVEATLSGVPFVPVPSGGGLHLHSWHRVNQYDAMMRCIECGKLTPTNHNCGHVETWLRTKDGIYRCKACGLVDASVAAPGTLQGDAGGFLMMKAGVAFQQMAEGAKLSTVEILKLTAQINAANLGVGFYPDDDDHPTEPRPLKKHTKPAPPHAPNLRPRRKITFED